MGIIGSIFSGFAEALLPDSMTQEPSCKNSCRHFDKESWDEYGGLFSSKSFYCKRADKKFEYTNEDEGPKKTCVCKKKLGYSLFEWK